MSLNNLYKFAFQEGYKNPYYRRIERLINNLREEGLLEIIESKEHILYPKKLFKEDETLELLFISKDKIIICSGNEEDIITLKDIPLDQKIRLELNNFDANQRKIELKIHLLNREELLLSSTEDTNDSWKSSFYHDILNVYKFLSN